MQYTVIYLGNECQKGILNHDYYDKTNTTLLTASVKKDFRDNHFYGSFCPKASGMYRLVYEGSDDGYEDIYSKYVLNGHVTQNRTTNYYHLNRDTCYPYYTTTAVLTGTEAYLYYEEEGGEKQLMNSEVSYTCPKFMCFPGSLDSNCYKHVTLHCSPIRFYIIFIYIVILLN